MANNPLIAITIIGAIILILYLIFIVVCAKEEILMFKPYTPPPLGNNSFTPFTVTPLTPAQIAQRNANIQSVLDCLADPTKCNQTPPSS